MKKYFHIVIAASVLSGITAQGKDFRSEPIPDPKAVKAFQDFWQSFEEYERATMQKAKRQYQVQWDKVKADLQQQVDRNDRVRIEKLKEAEVEYRDHLRKYPDAENRPYVMLNLAQILNMLAESRPRSNDVGNQYRQQALAILKEITTEFPAFDKRAETLYLRAIIFESLNFNRDAQAIWRTLASAENQNIYTVYANLALGDNHFDQEEPSKAIPFYKTALKHLKKSEAGDMDYEMLRVEYRLAWAAYRAADLELAISSALPLLKPGRSLPSQDQRQKVQQDAIELIGDTLYEYDDLNRTKSTLKNRDLGVFASEIGSRILQRYHANNLLPQTADLGHFLVSEFPLAKSAPEWLNLSAGALHSLGRKSEEVDTLERLAMLLPKQSLWRSRHQDDYEAIRNMESLSKVSAKAAAAYHYDHGLASGNKNSFVQAAAFFTILIDFEPQSEEANLWRARRAHCHYFSGNLDKADQQYTELKEKYKLNPGTLEASSYQQVMTRRKKWMGTFSAATESGADPKSHPESIAALQALTDSINQFANRFPGRNRAVELLLMAGSANSDHGFFDKASQFWERVLISNPTIQQRADAIRGLIAATVHTGSTSELVNLTRRFLKLEDWSKEGLSLGDELKGVLSTAALNESERLNNNGEIIAAGALLVQLAQEFKDLPRREKIYRDGAYMLAIAGDWPSAEQAAKGYLGEGLKQNAGDMQYLIARSAEFQVRFIEASREYISLGKNYPSHSRSMAALQRSENLAIAENAYDVAGESAELIGDRQTTTSTKLAAYESAYDHFLAAEDPKRALLVAQKRRKISSRRDDVLQSDLMVAKATFEVGNKTAALEAIESIAKQTSQQRRQMRDSIFQKVAGESNLLLGIEARRFFTNFDMFERQGDFSENLRIKTKYFEQLSKHFDAAATSEEPEFSTKARYLLAQSAEEFADAMRSIKNRVKVNDAAQERYQQAAQRLSELAKKYHGNNLLAKNRNPQLYKNNEWVQKSAIKLTGYGSNNLTSEATEAMPPIVNLPLPQQWSL